MSLFIFSPIFDFVNEWLFIFFEICEVDWTKDNSLFIFDLFFFFL